MCPATHILFWLLTFLRLKIYLQPLVPLFFGEFISYAFKKKPKNKFKKPNKNSTVGFFCFFFKDNKVFIDHNFRAWLLTTLQSKTGPAVISGVSRCTPGWDSQWVDIPGRSGLLTVKLGEIGVGEEATSF